MYEYSWGMVEIVVIAFVREVPTTNHVPAYRFRSIRRGKDCKNILETCNKLEGLVRIIISGDFLTR